MKKLATHIANLKWMGTGFEEEGYLQFGFACLEILKKYLKNYPVPYMRDVRPEQIKEIPITDPTFVIMGRGHLNLNLAHFNCPELIFVIGVAQLFPNMNFNEISYRDRPSHGRLLLENNLKLYLEYPQEMKVLAKKARQVAILIPTAENQLAVMRFDDSCFICGSYARKLNEFAQFVEQALKKFD